MSQEAVVAFLKRLDEDAQLKKKFFDKVLRRLRAGLQSWRLPVNTGSRSARMYLKKAASTMPAEGELSDEQLSAVAGGVGFEMGSMGYRVLQVSSQLAAGGKALSEDVVRESHVGPTPAPSTPYRPALPGARDSGGRGDRGPQGAWRVARRRRVTERL